MMMMMITVAAGDSADARQLVDVDAAADEDGDHLDKYVSLDFPHNAP